MADVKTTLAGDSEAGIATRLSAIQKASGAARATLQVELLSYIEEQRIRNGSSLVAEHGFSVLLHNAKHPSFLGDDAWNLYERVYIASLDSHQTRIREECLSVLGSKFPNSIRVKRLTALRAEAEGKTDEANALYTQILNEQPTNAFAMKRRASILRASGAVTAACDELTRYVEIFSSDVNGWEELSECYIACEKYEMAKFALEELILLVPEHYLYHTQYAEVCFTLGGKALFDVARHYFAQSLELKPDNNARALYGLALCLRGEPVGSGSAAAAPSSRSASKVLNTAELHAVVQNKLLALYKAQAPALLPIVEASLKQLQS